MHKKAILNRIDRSIEVRKRRIQEAKIQYENKVTKNKKELQNLIKRRKFVEEQPARDKETNQQQSAFIKRKWNDPEFLEAWVEGSIAVGRKIHSPRLLKYIA